jgi:FkbM family methyltransferase
LAEHRAPRQPGVIPAWLATLIGRRPRSRFDLTEDIQAYAKNPHTGGRCAAMGISEYARTLREITRHPLNVGREWSAIGDYLRWNIGRRLLRDDHVLPMANDAVIIVSNRQNFATLCYTCGLWDFEDMLFLMHLLRPGNLFVDIGANAGGYTVLASAVAGARTAAFEPVPSTHAELRRNVLANGIEALALPRCIGLGDAEGTMTMTAGLGSLNHVVTDGSRGDTVQVPVRRLDDVLDLEGCRLIKIDAEGFEMNVLRGAARTIANPELAAMIVELNGSGERYGNSDASVHQEITGHGFVPHRYDPLSRRLTALATFNRGSLNTLYVRDPDAVTRVLASAAKVRVRGRDF